ncbi:hypothetical protein H257_05007 [Aphanomyces astaci]|uniref:Uncharacterized protein n=1 Tax=Aphanomyces astaci TaxID=112090 RepID=W4GTW7_APHAT|nr:hypothetical protein H257_05007 [Aphanomyces astaci]ETV82348.1 hypothetical protein H257_05007 [Aphanomyces astaci]|eukprot:XP_009828017.1 hypothetical protein H257_05007 [Aphanomyces astaci]
MPSLCRQLCALITCGGDVCDIFQCVCAFCVCCHDKETKPQPFTTLPVYSTTTVTTSIAAYPSENPQSYGTIASQQPTAALPLSATDEDDTAAPVTKSFGISV